MFSAFSLAVIQSSSNEAQLMRKNNEPLKVKIEVLEK